MADIDTKVEVKAKTKISISEPKNFNVIYMNDEVTTCEFVIETLTGIFNYNEETASALTVRVHEQGSAVVATLPYEMAEQKGIEVTLLARHNGFPLQVKIEQEN